MVGVPGVVAGDAAPDAGRERRRARGPRFADELADALGLPVTLENDINLAALGEQWQGVARGVDDFVFLSVGTGMGAGVVLGGELHRGHNGAAGEIDFALQRSTRSTLRRRRSRARGAARPQDGATTPRRAVRPADDLRRRANGDRVARAVVAEVARRIALHVAPIAAVADVELVVLGGGIGANGDLLLAPLGLLGEWLPFPPRVEVSTLGEAPSSSARCRSPARGA